MYRILHVVNSMDIGGTETVLMNLYRRLDYSKFQFDFVVHVTHECAYESEIDSLGGRVIRTNKYFVKNYLSYSRWWRDFLAEHPEYPIVHGHQGSTAPVCLHEANRAGRISIAHSHATRDSQRNLRTLLWELNSLPTRFVAQQFLACSEEAGVDRFGHKIVSSPRFHIMKNGIDVARFAFNHDARKRLREEFGAGEDCFVVGHVGRFSVPKNHAWLLRVFKAVLAIQPNAMLLLIGQGDLENAIRSQANNMGIASRVRFLGAHTDVETFYSAMDAFCFPSLSEGLGMVAVEAQVSGLPVIASEAVPMLADIGAGLFERLSLNENAEAWAKALLEHIRKPRNLHAAQVARDVGYDISDVAEWLQSYYWDLIELHR